MVVSFIPSYPYQEAVWLHSQGGNRAPWTWLWLCLRECLVQCRGCVLLPSPTCPYSVGLCPHGTCFSHSWHHNSSTYWHQGKDMRDDNNSAFLSLDQGKGLLTRYKRQTAYWNITSNKHFQLTELSTLRARADPRTAKCSVRSSRPLSPKRRCSPAFWTVAFWQLLWKLSLRSQCQKAMTAIWAKHWNPDWSAHTLNTDEASMN